MAMYITVLRVKTIQDLTLGDAGQLCYTEEMPYFGPKKTCGLQIVVTFPAKSNCLCLLK